MEILNLNANLFLYIHSMFLVKLCKFQKILTVHQPLHLSPKTTLKKKVKWKQAILGIQELGASGHFTFTHLFFLTAFHPSLYNCIHFYFLRVQYDLLNGCTNWFIVFREVWYRSRVGSIVYSLLEHRPTTHKKSGPRRFGDTTSYSLFLYTL